MTNEDLFDLLQKELENKGIRVLSHDESTLTLLFGPFKAFTIEATEGQYSYLTFREPHPFELLGGVRNLVNRKRHKMKVKQLKEWLENFVDEADVEYTMDCFHGKVVLHVTLDGKPTGATLNLDKEEL